MAWKKIFLIRLNLLHQERIEHPFHCVPPFTLKYIQSLLVPYKTLEVKLHDVMAGDIAGDKLIQQILHWKPDVILSSVNMATFDSARKFIAIIREKQKVFTIAVGHILSECINEDFDVFVPGEGEQEVFELIKRVSAGKSTEEEEMARYAVFKKSSPSSILVQDLDALPFPCYSPLEIRKYHFIYPIKTSRKLQWGHVLSSRGCPYPCNFCSPVTRESYGIKVRLRNASHVVDEMFYLKSLGVNIISFDDDLFTLSPRHVYSICEQIQRRKLVVQWIAHARIDTVDYDLLKTMKNAGCVLLRFGVESGSERILKMLEKTNASMNWGQRAREIFGYARNLGIATHALLIIGSPTETVEEMEQTFRLTQDLMPDLMQIHFFCPYPGSLSYERFKLSFGHQGAAAMYHYNIPCINFSAVDAPKLKEIRARFYKRMIFNPGFFIRHLLNYFPFYLNNGNVFFRLLKGILL